MGSLLSVLLFASASAAADTPAPSETEPPAVPPAATTTMAADIEASLRPISFESRPSGESRAARATPRADLRNPFAMRRRSSGQPVQASQPAPARPRPDLADLKNPFSSTKSRTKSTVPESAPDLRDPFGREAPAPVLPQCPDTGGVPIQRPSKARPRCVQASRYQALAWL